MTRKELEKELSSHGWDKRYHGTHTALWQKEDALIDMTDRGIEISGTPRLPWDMVEIEDEKLVIRKEIKL